MILILEGISKDFGGLTALNKVNMTVEVGKVSALIGPNGAGKTTMFNIIAGVYAPTEGDIIFNDQRINGIKTHKLVEMGIARTFQLTKLFSNMTVIENVMVGRHTKTTESSLLPIILNMPRVRHEKSKSRTHAMELLRLAGIEKQANELARNLPHGQKRLLEMARAMATEPKLLLLDEPAAGLNHSEEDMLNESLREIVKAGTTILLVEHDMRMVMEISDWITVLEYGNKIAEGTPEEIGKNPAVIKAYLGREI